MSSFLKTIVAGVRKANLFVLMVSQGDTLEMLGGGSAKGLSKLLKEGFVKVELFAKPDPTKVGGLAPTGKGNISINGGETIPTDIPDMRVLFPPNQWELDFSDLLPNYNPPTAPIEPQSDDGLDLSKLFEQSRKHGWLSASKAKSLCWNLRGFSTSQIREIFEELALNDNGYLRGNGDALEWRIDRVTD
jgi:hypothetical protein